MKFCIKIFLVLSLIVAAMGQFQVRSYTRADGTVVSAYIRSNPSRSSGNTKLYNSYPQAYGVSGETKETHSSKKSKPASVNPCRLVDPGFIVCNGTIVTQFPTVSPNVVKRDSRGRIARSPETKKQFQSMDPCPANGKTAGRCPGYVIDHIIPLSCGGLDDPVNMQWQTVADGKAKDKWERKMCGK